MAGRSSARRRWSRLRWALALVALLSLSAACGRQPQQPQPGAEPTREAAPQAPSPSMGAGSYPSAGREIAVELDNFSFEPSTIELRAGDTVTLRLTNESGAPHTFTVPELDLDVSVAPGETEAVTVTARRAGTFPLTCRYHEGRGMIGQVVVHPGS